MAIYDAQVNGLAECCIGLFKDTAKGFLIKGSLHVSCGSKFADQRFLAGRSGPDDLQLLITRDCMDRSLQTLSVGQLTVSTMLYADPGKSCVGPVHLHVFVQAIEVCEVPWAYVVALVLLRFFVNVSFGSKGPKSRFSCRSRNSTAQLLREYW